MLEPGVGAQVIARPQPAKPPIFPVPVLTIPQPETPVRNEMQPSNAPSGEVPDIPRQFTLTAKTDRTLKRLIATYSEATGLDLKHSELLRAVLVAIEHAMSELVREAQGIGPLRRPKNERGREAEREELERSIARAFVGGMRACAALGNSP